MIHIAPSAVAALSGALLSLAYPPFSVPGLGCVGLLPLWYLCRDVSPREAIQRGIVWAAAFHATTVIWIFWATIIGGALAFLYLIVYTAVFPVFVSVGCRKWGRRWMYCVPVLWFAWEYLRSIGVMGFPWLNLAHTMTGARVWIQFADLTGSHGVSLWVALCNGCVYWVIEAYRERRSLVLPAAVLIVWAGWPGIYGAWRLQNLPPVTGAITIGVVQGNIDAGQRWSPAFKEFNFQKQALLSRSLKDEHPSLIVWSESAAISLLRYDRLYRDRFQQLADTLGVPIFTGALDFEADSAASGHSYNAAFLIRPGGGAMQRYAKRQLVPFGEHNPLEYQFPFLQKLDFGQANFKPGTDTTVFVIPGLQRMDGSTGNARFGALICFESIFPELARAYRNKELDFLVIITNDGWYGKLSAAYQHAWAAIYRAIETRRPVARCANTGVSLFLDRTGRVLNPSPIYEEWAAVQRLETAPVQTVYMQYGDIVIRWFVGFACLCLASLLIPLGGGIRNAAGNKAPEDTV